MVINKNFKNLSYLFIFAVYIYFSLNSLISIWVGINFYSMFITLTSIMSFTILFISVISEKGIKYKNIFFFGILLTYFLSYIYTNWTSDISELSRNTFYYTIIWSFPAIFLALNIDDKNIRYLNKYYKIVTLIFVIAVLTTVIYPFLKGDLIFPISFGGATYQTLSYICAIGIGFTLNLLTTNKINIFFGLLYIITLFIGMIIGAGRGAFLLLTIYVIYFCLINKNKYSFLSVITILISIIAVSFYSESNKILLSRMERVTNTLNSNGINFANTSDRNEFYPKVISLISQRPLTGYGYNGYLEELKDYPHNLFLESLLIGGVSLFFITLILNAYALIKGYLYSKLHKEYRIIYLIYLYSITLLMFSSSMLVTLEYWFGLITILMAKEHKVID